MPFCENYQCSLDWCMGTPELPGIMNRVFYISKSKIKEWPRLPKLASGLPSVLMYGGNFKFDPDCSFRYITVIGEKSQLTSEPQGEMPNQIQINKLTLVYPSVGPEATSLAAMLNNTDCVFIVQDMSGQYRVVGSKEYLTKVTVSQDNGQGTTGNASTTITIEAPDAWVAPFYTGVIEWLSPVEKMLIYKYGDLEMCATQWGLAMEDEDHFTVQTVLAGASNLPRGSICVRGEIPVNLDDHRFIVWRVRPPRKFSATNEQMVRAVDWEFDAESTALPRIVSAHNSYFKFISLSDGTALLVYALDDLTSFTGTVFFNLFEIKIINITMWDTSDPCLKFEVYNMFGVESLELLKWYVENKLHLSYN